MKAMPLTLTACILAIALATSAAHAALAPLTAADKDAFAAIGNKHLPVMLDYQAQAMQAASAWPVDDAKMCTIEQALSAESMANRTEELALLHDYEKAGKDIEPLIGEFLGTSARADRYFWHMASSCAAAQSARDGHGAGPLPQRIRWEAVYRDEGLLVKLDQLRAAQVKAETDKDRLESLSDLQSMGALLDGFAETIEGIRGLGGATEPRAAALIARLPALKAERARINRRIQAEVKPYTDPKPGTPAAACKENCQ